MCSRSRRSTWIQSVLEDIYDGFVLHKTATIHGISHWKKVEKIGVILAKNTPGADCLVVRLFAIIHDSGRENELEDPGHGHRAAIRCKELFRQERLKISAQQFNKLKFICRHHSDGKISSDPTVGVCWDADRLDITRVGIVPDVNLFSTEAGRILATKNLRTEIKKLGTYLFYKNLNLSNRKVLRQFKNEVKDYHKMLDNLMRFERRLPPSERLGNMGLESIRRFGEIKIDEAGDEYLFLSKPLILYHVTDSKNAASIIKRGVRPRFPGTHLRLQDEFGMPKGVYLTNKKRVKIFKTEVKNPIVLMVNLPKETKLWSDRLSYQDFYTKASIAPHLICKVNL